MPADPDECFAFASFRLYPRQRTLRCGSEVVAIGGRAFDVLLVLVARAGTIVSLHDLMELVWPSVTVEEANLRVQMGMLRKILSQCPEARRAIETIPLRGYCFILPVQHHPGEAAEAAAELPILLNPVIGRDEAIALVMAALAERRLVTITGPGGIGKTTVAVATATRHAGPAAFIDLSRARDADGATVAIAEALGLPATLPGLCEQLRHREVLLVLDTCDHIVEPMALLAETLLTHCPGLKLLVTSREALRAGGEWSHRLGPLAFPIANEDLTPARVDSYPAVTLFLDRVRAATHFAPAPRDLPIIAEICRRLDGIPLALEFAAARVADLGLRAIAARLDDCFSILTRGRRTALPRHRTLSATLDWSYGLLSDTEQRALRLLARLPGAFNADEGIASCRAAGCEHPPEALSNLYEKSLLSIDFRCDAPVYRLLDTTRTYVMAAIG
jgi:predicted ATPase/DNA-binding winged helix-turn-helix (wHTH) protein